MAGLDLFDAALAEEGVTGQLAKVARGIYMQESGGGRNTRTSNAGAMGGMQIIPSTFASVADKGWSISDPLHNARAGIRYLKQLDKQSGGDPKLTAAGYYGGPGGLEKARKGIAVSDPRNPNAPNTLQYGEQVASRLGKTGVPSPIEAQGTAPVQLASVGKPTPVNSVDFQSTQLTQAPVEAPSQTPQEWQQFQDQTAPQLQVADLQFGANMPQVNPASYTVQRRTPNFQAFSGWRGRV